MAIKLTETQRALLRAAIQHDNHLFTFPDGRRLLASRLAAKPMVEAGLAREVRARGAAPVWRRDKERQCSFALKLTAAGAKAIAAVADDGEDGLQRTPNRKVKTEPRKGVRTSPREERIADVQPPASFSSPRNGTKIDGVLRMLSRPEGATLEALVKATGWLPHTTYAALTGLRKRGYALERSRNEKVGPSVYRLTPPSRTGA
jgi:Protein of unknown function (DUF3489)